MLVDLGSVEMRSYSLNSKFTLENNYFSKVVNSVSSSWWTVFWMVDGLPVSSENGLGCSLQKTEAWGQPLPLVSRESAQGPGGCGAGSPGSSLLGWFSTASATVVWARPASCTLSFFWVLFLRISHSLSAVPGQRSWGLVETLQPRFIPSSALTCGDTDSWNPLIFHSYSGKVNG